VWVGTALLQALDPGRFAAGEILAPGEQFDAGSEIAEGNGKKDLTFSSLC